ncbi:MAG: hypothetical protein HYY37_00875 [Candidatus Aenigmarchaeota archaeon]|nr:hypothetical protein [Candidatus Aenigmarchaeota archaeon]
MVNAITQLNEKAFAFASATATAVLDIFAYVWHGIFQQPSVMTLLYRGFWSNWALMLLGLAGTVAGAYALGYLFARAYNRTARK